MKFSVSIRKWHKWLALIVGVQVLIWTGSGLFMSFVPIEMVRSEDVIEENKPYFLQQFSQYLSISQAQQKLQEDFGKVEEVRLKHLLDFPVFEFVNADKKIAMVHALSGELLSPISGGLAKKIALSRYNGDGHVLNIELLSEPLIEYRGTYPVWRIDIDNRDSTSFYVSPEDGSLKAVRGNIWRVYDFLWMLHIMDYSERKNFNHWWLVVAALLAVSLSISGFILFFYSFRRKEFMFFKRK